MSSSLKTREKNVSANQTHTGLLAKSREGNLVKFNFPEDSVFNNHYQFSAKLSTAKQRLLIKAHSPFLNPDLLNAGD